MASDVLALIPARAGSRGIPNKNFRELMGVSPVDRAYYCCRRAGMDDVIVTSDIADEFKGWLQRPAALAQDDTPMIDVVKHALGEIPGPPDQIILLVQPTQVLRQPKHLRAAIALLESSGADSVVSVVELPLTHDAVFQAWEEDDGRLVQSWNLAPIRRQEIMLPPLIRDGTVYAFWRRTVTDFGSIYGDGTDVRPLIIPPDETCPLDTPADWAEAERRLRAHSDRTE